MRSGIANALLLVLFALQGLAAAEAGAMLAQPVHDCGAAVTIEPDSPPADECCPAEGDHSCCGLACAAASAAPVTGDAGTGHLAVAPAFPAPPALTGRVAAPATRPPIG